jgi:hypothetical protein
MNDMDKTMRRPLLSAAPTQRSAQSAGPDRPYYSHTTMARSVVGCRPGEGILRVRLLEGTEAHSRHDLQRPPGSGTSACFRWALTLLKNGKGPKFEDTCNVSRAVELFQEM